MKNNRVPFFDLNEQSCILQKEINNEINKVIKNTDFILGKSVDEFELDFANYLNSKYCVSVNSGTDALQLSLRALDVGIGDEVITAANTYIATVMAISNTGAKPVLVDIESDSYNISVECIEKAITKQTKAIIPVHLYGQPADMEKIQDLAKKYGLYIIEDCAQAHGSEYKGKKVGTIGDIGCYSFYPSKNLGAFGDAGAIVTNNINLSNKIKLLRNYGQIDKNIHEIKGYNSRMDSIQATILRLKLRKLDYWNAQRIKHSKLYNCLELNKSLTLPKIMDYGKHVFHLYVIQVKNRKYIIEKLNQAGIGTAIHYPTPIHLQKAYQSLNIVNSNFPIAEELSKKILSLPMYPELKDKQIKYVIDVISSIDKKYYM